MTKNDFKNNFRCETILKLQKESNKINTIVKDKKISDHIYRLIKKHDFKTIMIYIPLKSEVNINALTLKLRQEGKMILVPFMEGKSFRLVQYRLPLNKKKFGIKEPKNSHKFIKKNIDLAVVPIVGTDRTLRRVGFGKGMYDRFFEKEKKYINYTLFVTRKLFISKHYITDNHDISADMILA
jgi:5-formyltetrahydrofolate cyclo-ligase